MPVVTSWPYLPYHISPLKKKKKVPNFYFLKTKTFDPPHYYAFQAQRQNNLCKSYLMNSAEICSLKTKNITDKL